MAGRRGGAARETLAAKKALVRRLYEEVYNQPDLELAVQTAAEFLDVDKELFARELTHMRTSVEHFRIAIDTIIGEGDIVFVRWAVTGVQSGPIRLPYVTIPFIEARPIEITGMSMYTVREGKIKSRVTERSMLDLLLMLGARLVTA